MTLQALCEQLRHAHGLVLKRDIQAAAHILGCESMLAADGATVRNGDDAAALVDPDGYTLLAAEGMLPSFVQSDPWFAGYCAVMVNVNDIAAMGGQARAVVNVLFTGDDTTQLQVLSGLRDAALAFGVPVVGGHTSRFGGGRTLLAAAIVGKAKRLITSFDAAPGDVLVMVIDLHGRYRGESTYYDAATHAPAARLRGQLALLPLLAQEGLVRAGKDISMAGIAGTLVMLCEGSGVGADLELDALPRPPDAALDRWLNSFPSFGFLLAVEPAKLPAVLSRCREQALSAAQVGCIQPGSQVMLSQAGDSALFWDLARDSLTGFGVQPTASGA